jgi:mycothiol synthase
MGHPVNEPALESNRNGGSEAQVRSRMRRVGFRNGTDDELTALHAIESVVDAERRHAMAPQPLESYMAFARNLPAQFDDHAWLVESDDGTPIASGYCWSNAAGDARVMECDVLVTRDHRRQRLGSRLMAAICEETAREGRSRLVWSTFDAVPGGEAFSLAMGAEIARVNRRSELALAEVDWAMVAEWMPARTDGYTLVMVDGAYADDRRADAVTLHNIMATQPHDDLDVGDQILDEEKIEQVDGALIASGRDRWTAFVYAPDGTCVGGTQLTFEPWEPATAMQQNTGIHPVHRGRGLAKWAKAAIVDRLHRERPEIDRVITGNAFSNTPMLAINDAMGFKVTLVRTEWQAAIDTVASKLRP